MERSKLWPGFVVPWIAFALLWAEFSPRFLEINDPYATRPLWGLAGGFIANGLSYLIGERLIGVMLRRMERNGRVPPAA